MKRIEVVGVTFGLLTVAKDEGKTKYGHRKVLAKCACGEEKVFVLGSLRSGATTSCGCEKKRITSKRSIKHGLRNHLLYGVFKNMKTRCYSTTSKDYKDYGGRGITICDEWLANFKKFYDFAISSGWKKGLQIDRRNNEKGYSPDNCRFVSPQINVNNQRINRTNTTGFIGVTTCGSGFLSRVRISGFPFTSKKFKTAKEAAVYRDQYCMSFGIETTLNFPQSERGLSC